MKAGIDEVGMGAIAGPVVVAVVAIREGAVQGLRDSKLVEEQERYRLAREIRHYADFVYVAHRTSKEIDDRGLQVCWMECMTECRDAALGRYQSIEVVADWVTSDKAKEALSQVKFLKEGDDNVYEIQAASLVAKTVRDRLMCRYGRELTVYGWEQNKGYPTKSHLEALKKHGPSRLHRKSWEKAGQKSEAAAFHPDTARLWVDGVLKHAQSKVVSDWERKFVSDMDQRLKEDEVLTARQMFFLGTAYRRVVKKERK